MLPYPVIAVNNALTKHMFDNRYGTGPIDARRHHSRDQRAARGPHGRRRRLRLVRTRHRVARRRHGRARRRHRNRSAQGDRSGDGRLPRDADERRRQDRRHLRHRHRQLSRHSRRALQADEGRRDRLQLGPLQRRARSRRRSKRISQGHDRSRAVSSSSTNCTTAARSAFSPTAGWSISPRPKAIRPR